MRNARFATAFSLFLLVYTPAGIQYLWWHARYRLGRTLGAEAERRYRNLVATWAARWAPLLVRTAFRVLGYRITFRFDRASDRGRPLLVVSNHVSVIDMVLIAVLMALAGRRNVRWVMAAEKRSHLSGIPRIVEAGGSVFIPRADPEKARSLIRDCARTAASDGASMVIFPEGTRYKGPVDGSEFRRVRPPKPGGYEVALDEMVGMCDVLVVTQIWPGGASGVGMTDTANDGAKHIIVDARIVRPERGQCPRQFLHQEFTRMDTLIQSHESSPAA